MGLFNRRKRAREDTHSYRFHIDDEFLDIPALDFFGPYSRSRNGRYVLGCCERDWSRDESGSFVLMKEGKLIVTGTLERPNDGKVADNGNFIINDWMFSQELNGKFYAFDCLGNELVRKRYNANLFNNGISDNGQFAVCQTCNSNNENSSLLTLFNLATKQVAMQARSDCGWASKYQFDVANERICLVHDDGDIFAFSFSGEFLDTEKWDQKRIERASPFELRRIAEDRLKVLRDDFSESTANEILKLLQKASKGSLDDYPIEKALVHRRIGETYELLQRTDLAIQNYEMALKLNPRIGLKRKLAALKGT